MRIYLYSWVKTIAVYFLFMSLVLNFMPDGQYRKYVRYFFSLMLLLVLTKPLGELTGMEELLRQEVSGLLAEEAIMEELQMGKLADEQQDVVLQACRQQIRQEAEELLAGEGLYLIECVSEIELSGENPGIRSIYVYASHEPEAEAAVWPDREEPAQERIQQALMSVYSLQKEQVTVKIR